jgi:hypothetical protein
MTLPLAIILGWLVLTTAVGVLAGLRRQFGLEEFMVGGRSFGLVPPIDECPLYPVSASVVGMSLFLQR